MAKPNLTARLTLDPAARRLAALGVAAGIWAGGGVLAVDTSPETVAQNVLATADHFATWLSGDQKPDTTPLPTSTEAPEIPHDLAVRLTALLRELDHAVDTDAALTAIAEWLRHDNTATTIERLEADEVHQDQCGCGLWPNDCLNGYDTYPVSFGAPLRHLADLIDPMAGRKETRTR